MIEKISFYLKNGPLSPKTILTIAEDLGWIRKEVQIAVQIGLERGVFELDEKLHIKLGKNYGR